MMINYEEEKKLARSDNPKDRITLASSPDTTPEILYFLTNDTNDLVRQATANNDATPRHADVILAQDNNIDVRNDLGAKLVRITPHLSSDKRQFLYKLTEEALSSLARDQVLRVREILADALKDISNAPNSIIKLLANDKALSVAEPILIYSPVLSEKDILQIISSNPIQGAFTAVAQREKVTENMASSIIKNGSNKAISCLLNNHKAEISAQDMDKIVEQASKVKEWHAPIISRPLLSKKSIRRLANFIAMNLLDNLQDRFEMDDETLIAITQTIEARIANENVDSEITDVETTAYDEAQKLMRVGALTQDIIEDTLASDSASHLFVMAAVSLLAEIDYHYVIETLTNKKSEEIVALCWKAGLSAHIALQFQIQIARIPLQTRIAPLQHSGHFALSEEKMNIIIKAMPKQKL